MSCATCEAACEQVSDDYIHVCVIYPPSVFYHHHQPVCGISHSDYRRVLRWTSKYTHWPTDRIGHESVAAC